jgi:hypothetical protein
LLAIPDVRGESECTWKLHLGRAEKTPFAAPTGINKYVISTTGKRGLKEVASELRKIQDVSSEDVSSIRELTTLGNVVTAKMSKRALVWLCRQEELDECIKFVELDQQVSLFTGPIDPPVLVPPPTMET